LHSTNNFFSFVSLSFKNSHFLYFRLFKSSNNFSNLFLDNLELKARKTFKNTNISVFAVNFNKNYFTYYEPDCSINASNDDDLVEMSLGLDIDDNNEDINEFNNKLVNWLEKLDEGVLTNGKFKFFPE
jgi:hypothetical protein